MIIKPNVCDIERCFMCRSCIKEWHPAIAANKTNIKVKKGDVIFKEGDPVTGIYFVFTGLVKVYKKWDAEKELIIRFAKEGATFGHRGLGNNTTYPVSAAAMENGVVCYISLEFFEATLKVNANFTYQLLMFFADELRESERKMRNLAHMPVKGRLAESLMALQKQFGTNDEGFINITMSRADLASYSGATYETVFRMINELVNDGFISLSAKSIRIDNPDALSVLAQDIVFR